MKTIKFLLIVILAECLALSACDKQEVNPDPIFPSIPTQIKGPFTVEGADILKNGEPVSYKGVNAMQTFGLANPDLMKEWNIEISREFIGIYESNLFLVAPYWQVMKHGYIHYRASLTRTAPKILLLFFALLDG